MNAFEVSSGDELWCRAFASLSQRRPDDVQPSRAGSTVERLHVSFRLSDPRQRWVISRNPPMNPAFAIAELIWILVGSNNAGVLNYWNRQLPQFAGATPTYPGAYGYRLRKQFGVDQLRMAVGALKANPSGRQVVLQYWDSRSDLPEEHGLPRSADVPCNLVSILKIRDGRLHWTQVMRSNDVVRGLPYNIVQFTTLQEIVADWLGVEVGFYNHWSDSLHIYESDLERFQIQPVAAVASNEYLKFSPRTDESTFRDLYRRLVELSHSSLEPTDLYGLVMLPHWPAFQSLLSVVAAEAARKRGWSDEMAEMERLNQNPQLRQLWDKWKNTRKSRSAI